jgi:ABC-type antimicrobial peptide transport system permease subunit
VAPWRGVRQVFAVPNDRPGIAPFTANTNVVSSNYFEVMGIRLVRGRTFTPAESRGDQPVAIVSQAMANLWWNGRDAIGQRFRYGSKDAMQSVEVVGVAQNVRSLHVGAVDGPLFYLPANPAQPAGLSVIARTPGVANFSSSMHKVARELDPNVLVSVRSVAENLDRETAPMRTGSLSAVLLGGLALMLAAIGIYGVMSYAVSQRTREIGIRMALGAPRGNVLQLMLAESMRPVFAGMMIGVLLAMGVSMASSKLLVGVSPLDPLAYVAVLTFLAVVALLASYLPARGALRVDPLTALRYE